MHFLRLMYINVPHSVYLYTTVSSLTYPLLPLLNTSHYMPGTDYLFWSSPQTCEVLGVLAYSGKKSDVESSDPRPESQGCICLAPWIILIIFTPSHHVLPFLSNLSFLLFLYTASYLQYQVYIME